MAVEWQLSGNCFLQAVVAGISYVRNLFSAGDYVGVLRATAVTWCEEIHKCGNQCGNARCIRLIARLTQSFTPLSSYAQFPAATPPAVPALQR